MKKKGKLVVFSIVVVALVAAFVGYLHYLNTSNSVKKSSNQTIRKADDQSTSQGADQEMKLTGARKPPVVATGEETQHKEMVQKASSSAQSEKAKHEVIERPSSGLMSGETTYGAVRRPSLDAPENRNQITTTVRRKISKTRQEETFIAADQKKSEYDLILAEVKRFCRYLDGQSYVNEYRISEGTYSRGLDLIEELAVKRPLISGETQNMATLTSNLYHLYRVMGRKNIGLIKDVFVYEQSKTEEVMDLFYRWLIMDMGRSDAETKLNFDAFYDYGAFFLATLGGKSYLARRDSKLRILITYYSILIVDKADNLRKNRCGIDIRPHLQMLVDDINNYKNLKYGYWYLKKLGEIIARING